MSIQAMSLMNEENVPGLRLTRIGPLVLGLVVASAILTSCGQGVGGGGSGSAGGGVGFTVALSSPASTVYTHGTVAVQVTVSGGTPDSVELLRDSTLLVSLPPPYQYNLDTASTPEGSYQLFARATKAGQSFTSEPRTVVVDRTPPAVASRVPGPNATNVFVDDPILVGFTKPLLPASVAPGSFALRSGSTSVPTTPLLSGDGKTVMLVRHISLAIPAMLTLTVTSSITDLAGNALLGADAWSWSVPEWVAVGGAVNAVSGRGAGQPALALDPSGKPVVAFNEYDGTRYNDYVRQWTGTTWQPVGAALNAVSGQNPAFPVLALDGSGKAFVAFYESDGNHNNVYVRQWTGSTWQPVGEAINAVAGHSAFQPALALDPSGKPVVAFREYDGAHDNVYVRQWTGSAWQPVGGAVNAVAGREAFDPVLALDGSSKPVVAFVESDGTYFNIYVSQWTGSAWQSVGGAINAVAGHSTFDPALALDGSGKPVVAFDESDGTHDNVYLRRWTGSAWQSVGAALNAVSGHDAFRPALALDESGKPVAAFIENDGSHNNVYVRQWTGSAWQPVGAALNAISGQNTQTQQPALALDGSGKAVVAFSESDGTHDNVYVLHSNQ